MPITKRDHRYHYDAVVFGQRLRCALGVSNREAAIRLENKITFALADGPKSAVWNELRFSLPPTTFRSLTAKAGVPLPPSLKEFETKVFANLDARYKLGEIAVSTYDNYYRMIKTFFDWLGTKVTKLSDVSSDLLNGYLAERRESGLKRGGSGRGVATEAIVLKYVFNYAVESGALAKSPLTAKYRPNNEPPPPNPFTAEELERMDSLETATWYLLLRFTGMRASDVTAVTWESINWTTKTLNWKTKKRGTYVQVPLAPPLYAALARDKQDSGRILSTDRSVLYRLVRDLGKRAEVVANPHKFRSSLVCELLGKGASLHDVSVLIGDSPATVAKYYAATSDRQQDRIRNLMEAA